MTEASNPPPSSSKGVARYDGPRTIEQLTAYSQLLAVNTTPDGRTWRNDALPATFRGNPASVAFAVEYAKALDVSPVTALIGIHIVDGKPTASAGLISALVRRAGHRIRTWTEGTIEDGTFRAITTIVRADDPEFTYESIWTLDRAVRAGLMKRTADGRIVAAKERSAWATYPENMCKSRTITEASRDAAEDAILGVHYTPEELGVDVDESGEPVYTVTTVQASTVQEAAQEAATQVAEQTSTETPATDAPAPEAGSQESDVDRADRIRIEILRAKSVDDLRAVWSDPEGLNGVTAYAKGAVVGNEIDEETTLYDLFGRAVKAIEAGSRLTTRFDEEDGDGAAAAGDDPDSDGDVHDAEIVEDEAESAEDPVATPTPTAEQLAADLAWKRDPADALAELDKILAELPEVAVAEVREWAAREGLNPGVASANSATIAKAIVSGRPFTDATLASMAAGDVGDPLALVQRVLGGVVISEHVHTPQEQHETQLRENSAARGQSGRDAAREAARAAANR